ncbi:MAG TPA: plastocyanin/azurin family copper-binding protein [Solirubrobacterales bacterium]|nr:plastocyanin/azurin family copper-binding protein [Solirubrobacterales bacterium]
MKKLAVLAVLVLASFALVACGDSDDSTSGDTTATTTESQSEGGGNGKAEGGTAGGSAALDIASPSSGLAYDSDSASAKAGKITLTYTNPQPIAHDVAIENTGGEIVGKTELVTEGSDSTEFEVKKAGEYTFYCTVPGHREAGMEGTLTVK